MNKYFRFINKFFHEYSIPFILTMLFLLMMLIHRYIFLYADDLYYCNDASYGLDYLPYRLWRELNANGRVWIGLGLLGVLKYQIFLFRILNPLIIAFTALLMARISVSSERMRKHSNSRFMIIATFCAGLFFLFLPIRISHTTIYYAACAFNYLYPTALVMLYGYMLYKHVYNDQENPRSRYLLIVLAFFAGSSTQQTGMIAIGYTVLIFLYFHVRHAQALYKRFLPYFAAVLGGYSLILYGSLKRMLFERQMGQEVNLAEVVNGLLTINIFSLPVALFVLLICVSCLFWLYYFRDQYQSELGTYFSFLNRVLLILLPLATIGYIYVVLFQKYPVQLFTGGRLNLILSLSFLAFTLVYLVSILYCSYIILWRQGYPILFFNCINAFGAQLMLLVVNARFAYSYKVMFPSLLLMSIFMIVSVLRFYQNKAYLALAMILIFMSIASIYNQELFIIPFILVVLISTRLSFFIRISPIVFLGLALLVFGITYHGYKKQAVSQIYNLQSIQQYHNSPDKQDLWLKQVPISYYGYNLGIWNEMPYYMRQCYKIDPNTRIHYYDEISKNSSLREDMIFRIKSSLGRILKIEFP